MLSVLDKFTKFAAYEGPFDTCPTIPSEHKYTFPAAIVSATIIRLPDVVVSSIFTPDTEVGVFEAFNDAIALDNIPALTVDAFDIFCVANAVHAPPVNPRLYQANVFVGLSYKRGVTYAPAFSVDDAGITNVAP